MMNDTDTQNPNAQDADTFAPVLANLAALGLETLAEDFQRAVDLRDEFGDCA